MAFFCVESTARLERVEYVSSLYRPGCNVWVRATTLSTTPSASRFGSESLLTRTILRAGAVRVTWLPQLLTVTGNAPEAAAESSVAADPVAVEEVPEQPVSATSASTATARVDVMLRGSCCLIGGLSRRVVRDELWGGVVGHGAHAVELGAD
ncbi:protein of unknown function [Agreia sp. COWG]|nr:protein of unknown function [Agreia sp. COWG]